MFGVFFESVFNVYLRSKTVIVLLLLRQFHFLTFIVFD
jgi:hypothetical protein